MLKQPIKTFTILASTALTGDYSLVGNASAVQLPEFDFTSITYRVKCTALTGSTYAEVYIQTSPDGGTTWVDMVHFPQINQYNAPSSTNFFYATVGADDATRVVSASVGGTVLPAATVGVPHLGRLVNAVVDVRGANSSCTIAIDALMNTIQPH